MTEISEGMIPLKNTPARLKNYIEQEVTFHSFYKVMAGCTTNVFAMQIFLDLSDQSLQHVALLKELYRSLCGKNYLSRNQAEVSFSPNFNTSVKRHLVLLIQTAKDYANEGISSRDSRMKEAFFKLWSQETSVIQRLMLVLLPD